MKSVTEMTVAELEELVAAMPRQRRQALDRVEDAMGSEFAITDLIAEFWGIRRAREAILAKLNQCFPSDDNTDLANDIMFVLEGIYYVLPGEDDLDEYTRSTLYTTIARAAVKAAQERPGEWVAPFEDFDWDQVIYDSEADIFTVGFNGDYEDMTDPEDAVRALVGGWKNSADADVVDGTRTQREIDATLRAKAREMSGIIA